MTLRSLFKRLAPLAVAVLPLAGLSAEAGAAVIYDAGFEGQTVGAALPTGAPPGLPDGIDPNLTATVENAASVAPQPALASGNFARLSESNGEAPDLRFDSGTSFTSGIVTVSMDLLFEGFEDYHVLFREGAEAGGSAIQMADIDIFDNGSVRFASNGGTVAYASYTPDTSIHLEAIFDLDNNTWDALWDGLLVVDDAAIFDDALGRVVIGFQFSGHDPGPGQDGFMQLDNYRFEATLAEVPEPATAALFGAGLLGLLGLRRRRIL